MFYHTLCGVDWSTNISSLYIGIDGTIEREGAETEGETAPPA